MMQQRFEKNAYLDLFDGPDGNLPLSERKSSITALQALFLMNSEFIHKQSDAIAERLPARGVATSEHTKWAYETILGRPPASRKLRELKSIWRIPNTGSVPIVKSNGVLSLLGAGTCERC